MAYDKKEILKKAPPPIDLAGSDLDLFRLAPEELAMVPFDRFKLTCCVYGCNNGPTVRDYGISPTYYVVNAAGGPWHDLSQTVFYCGKHSRLMKQAQRQGKEFIAPEGYKKGPAINQLIKK